MKATALAAVSLLALSGWALAAQKTEQKQDPSAMEHMMKEGKEGEHMQGMARMMKMMDQCSAMMESAETDTGAAKESQKQ